MGFKRLFLAVFLILSLFFVVSYAVDLTQDNILPIASAWVDDRNLDVTNLVDFIKGDIPLQNFIGAVPGMKYEATTAAGVQNGKLVYGAKVGSTWYVVEDPLT